MGHFKLLQKNNERNPVDRDGNLVSLLTHSLPPSNTKLKHIKDILSTNLSSSFPRNAKCLDT